MADHERPAPLSVREGERPVVSRRAANAAEEPDDSPVALSIQQLWHLFLHLKKYIHQNCSVVYFWLVHIRPGGKCEEDSSCNRGSQPLRAGTLRICRYA